MARILSGRCLGSADSITFDGTTLEVTTTVDNQTFYFKKIRKIGSVQTEVGLETISSFSLKATDSDILVKFNDTENEAEEMSFLADTWESINEFASIGTFTVKETAGAKFIIRLLAG